MKKREMLFISVMTVFGIALGLGIIIILASIAVPSYSDYLLTLQEKADFEMMSKSLMFTPNRTKMTITSIVLLILAIASSALFASVMNPNILNALRHKKTMIKAMLVFLVCLGYLLLPLLPLNKFFSLQSASPDITSLLLSVFLTGILWFFAGETGWAGDFSSWKLGNKAMPASTFILGGLTGIFAYLLSFINSWAFNKYFILVSEVLDRSGETSYLGFKLLTYELVFMSGMSLCILAGITVALSPTYKETKQRISGIFFPALLYIVLIAVVAGVYLDASKKYDLNKKDLAEAVGIPGKASTGKTIVILTAGEAIIQELPMQVKGNSFVGTNTIELSYENLKKLEDYLDKHKEGSVFLYAGREALINGYHALWDIKKGIEWQFKSSSDMLLPRMILLARLKSLPVTTENLSYLKSFADKSKWHVGGKYGIKMAEAFMHFNMPEEAKAYVKEAREKGADVSKTAFLNEPVITNGRISGLLKINGKAAPNIKIALLEYTEPVKKLEDFSLTRRLLDVTTSDHAGKFSFEYLGKGSYTLAIMADKETIPYDLPKERLSANTYPGGMKISFDRPALDIGDINIVIRK